MFSPDDPGSSLVAEWVVDDLSAVAQWQQAVVDARRLGGGMR
jgi:hypothetical protein